MSACRRAYVRVAAGLTLLSSASAYVCTPFETSGWFAGCSFISVSIIYFSLRNAVSFKQLRLSFAGENHPPVENCSPTLAAAAGYYSDHISSPLDDVAKPNVLIINEPRHTIWLAFMVIVSRFLFIFHNHHLFAWVVSNDSYAPHAFSNGGTTVVRLVPEAIVIASFTAAAVAVSKSDSNNAIAPVTNGAAALVPPKVGGLSFTLKLVTPSPGALSPRRPMELPRFE